MPQIGPMEIVMVGLVALLVFGPQRLPGMARGVGRQLADLKKVAHEFKSEFNEGMKVSSDDISSTEHADERQITAAGGGETT